MKAIISRFPVVIPNGFKPWEIHSRAGKLCPGQEAPYKPRWGGGFNALRGPDKVKHRALDIMAAIGAHIVCVDHGQVMQVWRYKGEDRPGAGYSAKGGHYVRVRHDWGVSYYAHMHETPYVLPGEIVGPGHLLGVVGRSGNALPGCAHLHLSITVGQQLVDPYPYLLPLYQQGQWKEGL